MTHVLMTYPRLIPSVLLCGQRQFAFLARAGKIEFRSIQRNALSPQDCGWADVVFMVRSDSELEVELAKKWACAGKRVFYVLDDDLLHVPDTSSSGEYYSRENVKRNIQTLLVLCDGFISPSEVLREKYGGDKAALIVEPSPIHPPKMERLGGVVRIGFAGSIDRADDLDTLLGKVIEILLERYNGRISIEFFGAHPKVANTCHLKCIPYRDGYEAYQRTMEELDWDIGLAPMPETAFHACKHYNKFIEYAGCGIAGVYSDTVPYTRVVRDGENGLLCANTPEAWIAALSRLIDDVALRSRIAKNARMQTQTEFSVEAAALALEQTLGDALSFVSPNHDLLRISARLRVKMQAYRVISALRRYGTRAPAVALQKLRQRKIKKKESIDT